jgi:uncharacterized protein with GYD domain
MPLYLYQAAYTNESWTTQLAKRENVADRVHALLGKLGGQLKDVWYAFGEYDVVAIVELPSNEAAAALAMTLASGGSVKSAKTTPLMSVEAGLQAMKLAAESASQYRPPVS